MGRTKLDAEAKKQPQAYGLVGKYARKLEELAEADVVTKACYSARVMMKHLDQFIGD